MDDQTFEKVLLLKNDQGELLDRGTLTMRDDGLHFDGKKLTATFDNVRGASLERGYARITHGSDTGLTVSYLSRQVAGLPRRVKEENQRLVEALQERYGSSTLSAEEETALRRMDEATRKAKARRGVRSMWIGAAVAAGGLILTIATYANADPGGSYLIAWGPVVAGVFMIIGGFVDSRKHGGSR